ncbi:MAG: translation initiation factor IF-3 [spirochete symbiont of Stewartia floridana]|nr:MAG: translation initiation factor IF-3 [spirochete symbiont of Stewartia floridana]
MAGKDMQINEEIRIREVRLIDQAGGQAGIVPTAEALNMAREAGLDLVEVSPQARPPVCKILNYGKYKYELEKRSREQKKKTSQTRLKEVRMQPKIDQHDLNFKAKHAQEFLNQGNKVKVTIRFRGRELAHTELGRVKLDSILRLLNGDSFKVDSPPRMEGRFMTMLLSPKSKKSQGK